MALYMITSKHQPEQCLQALDEIMAKGPEVLDKYVYGCNSGDHTGYAIVNANDKVEALSLVPVFLQDTACISEVGKYTPEEIRSFHTRAA